MPRSNQSLSLGQEMRLQQGLSPLQVRYGRMLEMNSPEVEEEVRRELDDNPALEAVETEESTIPWYRLHTASAADADSYERQIEDDRESLSDSLERQLGELSLSERQHLIALYVIGNIDPNGYITRSPHAIAYDIAMSTSEDVTAAEVAEVLEQVKRLDPPGVGAADLRECLEIQLRRREPEPHTLVALAMVSDHYELFSKMHWDRLRQSMNLDDEALRRALDVIRSLNPKPGAAVGDSREHPVIPDFKIDIDGDALTLTLLNNIPDLQIAESFREGDVPRSRRAVTADFAGRKRREAETFIKLLQMRQHTLFRIMSAILTLQRRFFFTGELSDLKPMVLRDVAAITGDDLSVISRATAGKYVATDYGIHPLKMFFSERPKDDDDSISLHRILQAIRKIVEAEDPSRPMSDEAIAASLKAEGLDVARRTVAKYREKLGIPVARLRKKI